MRLAQSQVLDLRIVVSSLCDYVSIICRLLFYFIKSDYIRVNLDRNA